ncbi:hypothetical protein V1517DRAFT_324226 [Lipomyces orientalis]|uniref:Uncharacterized protein n=1 Tax=Lipomyces orientalis TaxID=1233043 RepID=A0ACC3TMT0_9ASCO
MTALPGISTSLGMSLTTTARPWFRTSSKPASVKLRPAPLSIGHRAALDILQKSQSDRIIAMASCPLPRTPPKSLAMLQTVAYYVS